MLRDAKLALSKEQKARGDCDSATRETREELEELLRASKETEAELQQRLTSEGANKERLDAKLAAERVQREEAVSTITHQLSEAKQGLKDAEVRRCMLCLSIDCCPPEEPLVVD